jgi:hypothetical protein
MTLPCDLVKYCVLAVGFPMMRDDPGGWLKECVDDLPRGEAGEKGLESPPRYFMEI